MLFTARLLPLVCLRAAGIGCMTLFVAASLATRTATAQTTTWSGANANWSTAADWSSGVPVNGSTAVLPAFSNTSYTVNFDGNYSSPGLRSLTIDGSKSVLFTSTSTFSQTQPNTAMYADGEVIGNSGLGFAVYTQNAGSNTVGGLGLVIAAGPSTNGTYNLSGGVLNSILTTVGSGGTGTFNQSAGNANIGTVEVGISAGSVGTYNLSSGGSVAGVLTIGGDGSGTFVQNGGTVTAVRLTLGLNSGGTGVYQLMNGSLTVGAEADIGYRGHGEFDQSGGIATVNGPLVIGSTTSAVQGVYNLQNGTLSAQSLQINAGGTFNQTGGTITASTPVQLSGGTVTGTLQNLGAFTYVLGTFSGRLVNRGTLNLPSSGAVAFGNGLENDTALTLAATMEIDANGAGLNNNVGTLTLTGGTLGGAGPLVNNNLIAGYGTIAGTGGFTNNLNLNQGSGPLILSNTGTNTNNGTINLTAGQQLQLSGATLANAGTINLNSSALSGSGSVTNLAGGIIVGPGTISTALNNAAGVLLVQPGTTNLTQPLTNGGIIQLTAPASDLAGAAIANAGTLQGQGIVGNAVTNTGTIEPQGGDLNLTGLVSNAAGGTIRASIGAKVAFTAGLATNAGLISLTGGTFDNNSHPLNNAGQISGYGTLATGGLTNNGSITFTGGTTTINGDVTNSAGKSLKVSYNPAIFTGNVTNNGTVKITGTTVTFAGTLTNNGTYNSDPAENRFTDLRIGSGGALLGGNGDRFIVTGDLLNASTNRTAWDTVAAELSFIGGAAHHLTAGGSDFGATYSGYSDNFAWGILSLGADDSLALAGGGALYVHELQLAGGIAQVRQIAGNGSDLYYDPAEPANAYLGGRTFDLSGGGSLLPVPEPAPLGLLAVVALLLSPRSVRRSLRNCPQRIFALKAQM